MYEKELVGLSDAGARYLVIGGIAIGFHGFVRATFDLDILPDLESENLDKIIGVLSSLNYVPRVSVPVEELKDPQKRDFWHHEKNMKVFTFIQPNDLKNEVDLMIYHPLQFEDCFERRKSIYVRGKQIPLASVQDLLSLKKIAGRPKDLRDITILERMVKNGV